MMNTLCAFALVAFALVFGSTAHAASPVLQRGYDAGLSGANLAETRLNTSNVAPATFGLAFKLPVDDSVYAQPLYMPNVTIPNQGTHNAVYIATMRDTLYAFDADFGGAPLWSANFASRVSATPVPIANFAFSGNRNIVGNLGILSTPVIDPSSNIMYLVACTLENNTLTYRLHAVDITTGAELNGTGMLIYGSYGGSTFNARYQLQRASLALSGNHVVLAFGPVELEYPGGYVGWVMAYDKQTLVQSGVFATVTLGNRGGGVWQSGRPPAVDSSGYVYVFVGNGYGGGYDGVNNFSESVLKLDPANGLKLVDWFTPGNWSYLDTNDLDLSSSGPMLIPGTSLLAGGGKTGDLYLLNTGNLGHFNASDSQVVQKEHISAGQIRGGTVYWPRSAANGGPVLYNWGAFDWIKAYPFNGTQIAATPSSQGSGTQNWPGGLLALSANGEQHGSGVLWATVASGGDAENNPPVPGAIHAFNAENLSQELWNSTMNSTRDNFGNYAKFVPPLVANGKVYVATSSNQVAVYGLLSAPPTFSPTPGSYASAQTVTLTDTTPGAVIHYTTDGTTPTANSATYSAPLTVGLPTTIQAIAVANGYAKSAVARGSYVLAGAASSVNLSTVDNVFGIASNGTVVAKGGWDNAGYAYSASLLGTSITYAGSTYTIGTAGTADAVSNTTIPLPAGNYTALKLLGSATYGAQANQTFVVTYTDGTATTITQSLSDWWGPPQNFAGESQVLQMAYLIAPTGAIKTHVVYLYGYTFSINSAKTVKSLKLPANRDVVILAVDAMKP
jgi:Chitobiase/beta-hexosaminidase C-terminal domain